MMEQTQIKRIRYVKMTKSKNFQSQATQIHFQGKLCFSALALDIFMLKSSLYNKHVIYLFYWLKCTEEVKYFSQFR